jgi:hypothetical protein
MQGKLRLGAVVVVLLAILGLPAAAAAPSAGRSADDDDVEVVRVTAITVQEANLDLGEPGDSLGDQFIFSDDLFRGGEKVGIAGGVGTLVRLEPMVSVSLQFVATAELPRGQITVQRAADVHGGRSLDVPVGNHRRNGEIPDRPRRPDRRRGERDGGPPDVPDHPLSKSEQRKGGSDHRRRPSPARASRSIATPATAPAGGTYQLDSGAP